MTTDTIDALWAAFDEHPDDLTRLGIIADAYRDARNDKFADCLEWCLDNGRKPKFYAFSQNYIGWGWLWQWPFYDTSNVCDIPNLLFYADLGPASEDQYHHVMHNKPTISAAYQHLCQFWIGK